MLDIETVKQHLRISHDLEDNLINQYIQWSIDTVIEAVYDKYDSNINMDLLQADMTFQRAVILLTTYYYENRLTISEVKQHDNPYSVLNAIQSLRANRDYFIGDSNED